MSLADDQHFLLFARVAALRSSCVRRHVGAVIVRERHVLATGYNGTPSHTTNCNEGGCPRCTSGALSGTQLELCTCVHAEQNAVAQAARYGPSVEHATIYCTHQPCFNCLVLLIQAGISEIVYRHDYGPAEPLYASEYLRLVQQANVTLRQV